METEKRRLELIGITYNQIESGVYALLLQEVDGDRRIPIILGYAEAQAIECKLQNVDTTRPLTIDFLVNTIKSFGITVQEIIIKRNPAGVFTADVILHDGIETRVVDARSSDAVALAMRVDAPIYTSVELLELAGVNKESGMRTAHMVTHSRKAGPSRSEQLSQLQKKMQKAAENEDYEEAARIKALIDGLSSNE